MHPTTWLFTKSLATLPQMRPTCSVDFLIDINRKIPNSHSEHQTSIGILTFYEYHPAALLVPKFTSRMFRAPKLWNNGMSVTNECGSRQSYSKLCYCYAVTFVVQLNRIFLCYIVLYRYIIYYYIVILDLFDTITVYLHTTYNCYKITT